MSSFHAGSRTTRRTKLLLPGIFAATSILFLPQRILAQQGPATLTGVVLNASTGQPIARALVQVGVHALLTEHDGRFQFTAPSGTSESLHVTKPGYYDGPDQDSAVKRITFRVGADPVKVYLFAEGLITGSLASPAGDPLPNVYVQALRKMGDESGSSWTVAGQASSNSDGQFRIPLSAGDYVIETHYIADQSGHQQAIMPTMAPDPANGSSLSGRSALHLESGAEQHLDLRPELRATHEVHIRVDGGFNQGFPQIEAHLPNGLSFFPVSRQTGTPGDFIAAIPSGTFLLTMYTGDREGGSYAQASLTVGDSEPASVVMHSTRSLPVPVEVSTDSSSSAASDNTPPTIQQLGLHFIRTSQTAPQMNGQNIYLRSGRGETATFSLLPGSYRLLAQPLQQWYIASATVAGTDLLAHDLDVEAGETSAPLRIVVSNHTAGIRGTVKLNGAPADNFWVYLIAIAPGLTPVIPVASSPDGSFSRASLPPGTYRAIAFETRRSEDFSDFATLDHLTSYSKTFTVAAGETAAIDLDAVPTQELLH